MFKVSTLDSFSAAGASGTAYARTVPVTLKAGEKRSVKLQKNANIAVRFVRAEGLYIEAVTGDVEGNITALDELISTNGIVSSGSVFGSEEIYDGEPSGDVVLGAADELKDSFYPDGQFVIELRNETSETVSTFLSIGVEQISDTGVYTILEPNTQLETNTEMSQFNGTN
jgi:hypothetical protein